MQCLGEEAIAVAHSMALEPGGMCFPTYRQQGLLLAHRAMAQGELVAELIAGHERRWMPSAVPAICFTDPEVVVVGTTAQQAEQAEQAGLDVVSAHFPFAANGRAMTLQATEGFVRVLARRDNHLVLGWQAVRRGVSELAAAFSQSIEMGARLEDIGGTIPCASDAGRGGAGNGAARARARTAGLSSTWVRLSPPRSRRRGRRLRPAGPVQRSGIFVAASTATTPTLFCGEPSITRSE